MASLTTPNPLQVYIETSVILDLCLKDEERYQDAQRILEIFERHIGPENQIQVFASRWARMEAHSRLYEKLLEKKERITRSDPYQNAGRTKPAGRPPRECFPPFRRLLGEATSLIDSALAEVAKRSVFHLNSPDSNIWDLAGQLAEQVAIYPLDSIHVATAIHWGCSLFIATDRDLLDKITLHDPTVQRLFKKSLFPTGGPDFEAVSLVRLRRMRSPKSYGDALTWLTKRGF